MPLEIFQRHAKPDPNPKIYIYVPVSITQKQMIATSSHAKQTISAISAVACLYLVSERKIAHAVLLGCAVSMYLIQDSSRSTQPLLKPSQAVISVVQALGATADTAVDTEQAPPVISSPAAAAAASPAESQIMHLDDAVSGSLSQSAEMLVAVPEVHPIVADGELTGMSKVIFDNAFTPMPHQVYRPVVSTSFDGPAGPVSDKQQQALNSRNEFYKSIASGGDIQGKGPPGIQTMNYLTKA